MPPQGTSAKRLKNLKLDFSQPKAVVPCGVVEEL